MISSGLIQPAFASAAEITYRIVVTSESCSQTYDFILESMKLQKVMLSFTETCMDNNTNSEWLALVTRLLCDVIYSLNLINLALPIVVELFLADLAYMEYQEMIN